ncbi:hypothetical protein N657DRAFT_217006 [Parathielavia appendiculata]|uniref:Uncharacterized protein n=1 Tax=Parathielavia appendiculata TaxID=2587402 RepID=A0AAN6Z7X2_9PEZI|nr:hypothetical protein N657DRAFT_217006 [Parathielavia appendiculata]
MPFGTYVPRRPMPAPRRVPHACVCYARKRDTVPSSGILLAPEKQHGHLAKITQYSTIGGSHSHRHSTTTVWLCHRSMTCTFGTECLLVRPSQGSRSRAQVQVNVNLRTDRSPQTPKQLPRPPSQSVNSLPFRRFAVARGRASLQFCLSEIRQADRYSHREVTAVNFSSSDAEQLSADGLFCKPNSRIEGHEVVNEALTYPAAVSAVWRINAG